MRIPLSALLVVSLLPFAACSDDNDKDKQSSSSTSIEATIAVPTDEPEGTVTYADLDQNHVDTPVDYPQTPPVGGPHSPVWQTCQFYAVEFPKERGVHSLEHGAVWITFAPDLDAAEVAVLAQLADTGDEVLVSPFSGLPTPIVASAWGKQLQVESATDPRLAQFVARFDNGPQTPELSTPCAGGTTETD